MGHRRGPEPGVETARQIRAFEDYWCLGPSRSLGKLATEYRRRSDGGEDVPTVRGRTLEEWSATYRWRERAAQRERDEAAEAERRNRERVQKFRERVMRAIDIDASAYLQKVSSAIGPNGELGEPQIIRSASDLTKAVATFLQLAGEPQKHEVTGNDGEPLGHEHRFDFSGMTDEQLESLILSAGAVAEESSGRTCTEAPCSPGTEGTD